LLHFDYGGVAPKRVGLHHPSIAPYGAYQYDGGAVVLAVHNDREWRRFAETVLEDGSLADDPRFASNIDRVANRPALDAGIADVFGGLDQKTLIARLMDAGIAYGMINDVAGLSAHSQLRRVEVETPTGPVEMPAPPVLTGDAPTPGPVPAPGQHTDAIRREFS
jgi:crotonobetainyl-CoA:carnitine CoA-transferase CaiB-like acyl-CoA transferase